MADNSAQAAEMERLGYYGLLPLILAAIGLWMAPWAVPLNLAYDLHQFALAYTGVVAAYLAGVGAGGMLSPNGATRVSPVGGVVAILVVWLAVGQAAVIRLFPGDVWRYALVMVVLFYLLARDLAAVDEGRLPRWYGDLRMRLTAWVMLLLFLIALRLLMLGAL